MTTPVNCKMEGMLMDAYLKSAELIEISESGIPTAVVKADVIIVEGKVEITVTSHVNHIKSRIIMADWDELRRFYGWFMELPMSLTKRNLIGEASHFAIGHGDLADVMVIDGEIMPMSEKAFCDIKA